MIILRKYVAFNAGPLGSGEIDFWFGGFLVWRPLWLSQHLENLVPVNGRVRLR